MWKGSNYGKGEIKVKGVVNIVKSWKKENKGVSCRWEAVQSPKLQYSGHLMQRANSLEKTQLLGKIKDRRRRGPQRDRKSVV